MFRKRRHSTDNIFKSRVDDECRLLNNQCSQLCICGRDDSKNIYKLCTSPAVFEWEVAVYLDLLESNLLPFIQTKGRLITYMTKNLVSIRSFLKQNNTNVSFFLHELCSYVNSFRSHRFLHGNLHVDNIFVHPIKFKDAPRFFVIDYANSYILKKRNSYPQYHRTSFIGEFDAKMELASFLDWDFITLYIALKQVFYQQPQTLVLIDSVFRSYVKKDSLQQGLRYYQSKRVSSHD
jgi:hypothetical protein